MKKAVLVFLVCLQIFSFTLTAFAADVELQIGDEFYSYGQNPQKVAEILKLTEDELQDYCTRNNLELFAVNQGNTKQIKLDITENEFSKFIGNISSLPDGDILGIADELSGIENSGGSVTSLENQKFLKLEFKTTDSGGEYFLTQYITVAKNKSYRLSFYTAADEDTGYVETVFASLKSEDFEVVTPEKKATDYIIPLACIAFLVVTVLIAISVIVDIKKNRED